MSKRKTNDQKFQMLRKSGTANPHPEEVSDDLFKTNDFFDPRDLMQVKYEMLRRVKEDGWSITQAAAAFGFSRTSFYQAQSAFDDAGLAGFVAQRRGPREAHKLAGPVLKFIEDTRVQNRSVKTTELVQRIKQQFGIDVHRRSIERAVGRKKKPDL
jgi:transposase